MFANFLSRATLEQNFQSFSFFRSELVWIAVILALVFIDLLMNNENIKLILNKISLLIGSISVILFTWPEINHLGFEQMGAFYTQFKLYPNGAIEELSDAMFTFTKQGSYFKFLIAVSVSIWLIFSIIYSKINSKINRKSGFYFAVVSVVLGSSLLLSATHFVTLLLAIELASFGAYALIYFKDDKSSKEGALKYLIYGLLATALMLFGMSLIYASCGGVSYHAVASHLMVQDKQSPIFLIGLGLMSLGLLFKLGAFPMYFWVPDAYQSGPIDGLVLISILPKLGVLGNFILLFSYHSEVIVYQESIQNIAMGLAIISITLGNIFAMNQSDAKRLMGYSSVAQAGFLLLALSVFGKSGLNSLLYYSTVYLFMNFTAFLGIAYFENVTGSSKFDNWSGLGKNNIFWAVISTIALVALVGLPPTAGFTAKLFVLGSLLDLYQENQNDFTFWVLIIAAFNILFALFYYIKIPFYLFFKKTEKEIYDNTGLLSKLQALLMVVPLIILFVLSSQWLEWMSKINDIVNYLIK